MPLTHHAVVTGHLPRAPQACTGSGCDHPRRQHGPQWLLGGHGDPRTATLGETTIRAAFLNSPEWYPSPDPWSPVSRVLGSLFGMPDERVGQPEPARGSATASIPVPRRA